jgi:hypothetical protein
VKPIWKQLYGNDGSELWLGVPSWDSENKLGKLSIKFAYKKDGRIPRTAPEVPEDVVVEMIAMLTEHGRLSPEDRDRLERMIGRRDNLNRQLNEGELKRLAAHGAILLKRFHEEYEKDPENRDTEYQRGQVTGYRHLLDSIYGERQSRQIVEAASSEAGYTIPPAGPMTEDGKGYYGFDSGSHTYIGKL